MKKTAGKRILTLAVCAALALCLLPRSARAAVANNVVIDSTSYITDAVGTGWSLTFSGTETRLTLTGNTAATPLHDITAYDGDLTVYVTGDNYIETSAFHHGLAAPDGSLHFLGGGSLTITSREQLQRCISAKESVTFRDVTVTANASYVEPIKVERDMVVDGADVTCSSVAMSSIEVREDIQVKGGGSLTGIRDNSTGFSIRAGGAVSVTGAGSRLHAAFLSPGAASVAIGTIYGITGFVAEPAGGVIAAKDLPQHGPAYTVLTGSGDAATSVTLLGTAPVPQAQVPGTGDGAPLALLLGAVILSGTGLLLTRRKRARG